jgi:hypothetical protein
VVTNQVIFPLISWLVQGCNIKKQVIFILRNCSVAAAHSAPHPKTAQTILFHI